MGLNAVDYNLENRKGILASKCKLFTDSDKYEEYSTIKKPLPILCKPESPKYEQGYFILTVGLCSVLCNYLIYPLSA